MSVTTPGQPKAKMSVGKKILIGVGILFVIGLIVGQDDKKEKSSGNESTKVLSAKSEQTNSETTGETESKAVTVSAKNLVEAYEANEVSADNQYKGKTLYVSGKVTDIKKDIMDNIYVTLDSGEGFREVQCYFEDAETAAKMSKGMKVTFKGKCDGLMMNVLMKDCEVVSM